MSFSSVDDIVSANAFKRPARKPLEPLKTPGGAVLEDAEVHRLPGTGKPAVLWDARADDPWRGQRCAIRRCKNGVQYKILERLLDEDDVPPQPYIPSDNPLVIGIETAVNSVRPAVLVPVSEPIFLCIGHYTAFMDARNAKVVEEREARQAPSYPLHELNYEGATIEVHDSSWFTLTDGDGKVQKLEIWRMDEVKARMEGRRYEQEVLTPEQRRLFVLKTKFPNEADVPLAAKIATTYKTISG
jgi:hypothetical protein